LSIDGNVYAFDATVIDLCLNVFWWATFRKTKAAIKLHTLLDIKTSIPVFVHITPASVHDVNGLDERKPPSKPSWSLLRLKITLLAKDNHA
jgi:hypothetical protein